LPASSFNWKLEAGSWKLEAEYWQLRRTAKKGATAAPFFGG
jgi:hypothetical protein